MVSNQEGCIRQENACLCASVRAFTPEWQRCIHVDMKRNIDICLITHGGGSQVLQIDPHSSAGTVFMFTTSCVQVDLTAAIT